MSYIVVTGPTACGKTRKAVAVARIMNGEIISADSRQIFRGMTIGSGKDLEEYGSIPYHLIDIRDAGYKYNLFEFLSDEKEVRKDIIKRGKTPILCGGTGLYVESVVKGIYLPEVPRNEQLRAELAGLTLEELAGILGKMKKMHNITDVDTVSRAIRAIEIQTYYKDNPEQADKVSNPCPVKDALVIGIAIEREIRRQRITERLHARFKAGMIEEVESLINNGVSAQRLINYGLEYKYITLYLIGELGRTEMEEKLEIAIHQFAKRQMTWFRGMEKRGIPINWLPWDMPDKEFSEKVIDLNDKQLRRC